MKNLIKLLILAVVFGVVTPMNVFGKGSQEPEGIAQFKGGYISQEKFDTEVAKLTKAMVPADYVMSEEEKINFESQILNNLIMKQVYSAVMDELEIFADEDMLKGQFDQLVAQYGSEEALVTDIESKGFTYDEIKAEFEYQFRLQELATYASESETEVSDEEVRAFYDKNKESTFTVPPVINSARHILIQNQDVNPNIALDKIKTIREEIISGKDFAEAAIEYSEGPSGPNGGHLGSFGMGQMVPEFEVVAFAIPLGEVSEPVLTQFGYHLILVEDRTEMSIAPYEETVDYIKGRLKVDKFYQNIEDEAEIVKPDWVVEQ